MKSGVLAVALVGLVACAEGDAPLEPNARGVVADGLVYSADTAVMESFPVQLATTLYITNPSPVPVQVSFPDGCVVLLRAYPADSDEPVWDLGQHVACTMAIVDVTVGPRSTRTFEVRTNAAAILGNSLPDGRYRLEAYVRPGPGEIAVSAGVVDLAVPR